MRENIYLEIQSWKGSAVVCHMKRPLQFKRTCQIRLTIDSMFCVLKSKIMINFKVEKVLVRLIM